MASEGNSSEEIKKMYREERNLWRLVVLVVNNCLQVNVDDYRDVEVLRPEHGSGNWGVYGGKLGILSTTPMEN